MHNATEPEPDADAEPLWFDNPRWRWVFSNILIWLLPAMLAFGIVFNLICLLTIALNKKLFPKIARQNMLLITGCDVIVLAVSGTYYYHKHLKLTMLTDAPVLTFIENKHNNIGSCYFVNFLDKFLMNGTPFFHVSLTLERVLAVVLPLKVKEIVTVKRNCLLLLLLGFLGSLAPALWAALFHYEDGRCDFLINPTTDMIDHLQYNFDFYLSKLTLFVLLLAGCIVVAVTLRLQARRTAQLSNCVPDKARINRNVVTCTVMILMNVIFFLSQGPRAAMSLYEGYGYTYGYLVLTEAEISLIYESLYWVSFLHNLVNPFAYLLGKSFRKALKNLMCKAASASSISSSKKQSAGSEVTGV